MSATALQGIYHTLALNSRDAEHAASRTGLCEPFRLPNRAKVLKEFSRACGLFVDLPRKYPDAR